MELPAIGASGTGYGASGSAQLAAMSASSSATIDMTTGENGSLSITLANQVDMVYANMSQGGAGVDDQTVKALIMLLLLQILMKGGLDEQTQGALSDLTKAFQSSGQSDMTMIAMQASSMVQIDLGGMGGDVPVTGSPDSGQAGLDVMA